MRRLRDLTSYRCKGLDRCWSRCIQQVKCCGKTKGAMVFRRMLMSVVRREGAAVGPMLAELRQRQIIGRGSVG